MDFASLEIGAPKRPKPKTETQTFDFDEFQNGAGKPLSLTVMAPGAPASERETAKWRQKWGIGKVPAKNLRASEAELQKLVDEERRANIDLFARLVVDWNVEHPKSGPVECSLDNRAKFLAAFDAVTDALAAKMQEAAADLGNG